MVQENNLELADILKDYNLDPSKVKLIRHSLNDIMVKECYDKGFIKEYTQLQNKGFAKGYIYWMIFFGSTENRAIFYNLYKVMSSMPADEARDSVSDSFPNKEQMISKNEYFILEEVNDFKCFQDSLIIDWGKAPISWHQKATIKKPIIYINNYKKN